MNGKPDDIPADVWWTAAKTFNAAMTSAAPGEVVSMIEMASRAILVDRERSVERVNTALLDFAEDDPEGFARGYAHAKKFAIDVIRNAKSNSRHFSAPVAPVETP